MMRVDTLDRGLVARYAARALRAPTGDARAPRLIIEYLYEQEPALELGLPHDLGKLVKRSRKASKRVSAATFAEASAAAREALLAALDEASARAAQEDDVLAGNLRLLAADLELSETEAGVLEIVARYGRSSRLEGLCDCLTRSGFNVAKTLVTLLGAPKRAVQDAILANGSLVGCGVIWIDGDANHLAGCYGHLRVTTKVDVALDRAHDGPDALRRAILGTPAVAGLDRADFAHLAAARDLAVRVLRGALARSARGINLLFYGPPGGGKTELCKTLAADLGVALYPAGEIDGSWSQKSRSTRLYELSLAQRLLRRRDALVLFDEMEDLPIWPWRRDCRSKLFLNRLMENNATPVLWTCNEISWFDPALLRRMTLATEIKLPGPVARRRLWSKLARAREIAISEPELRDLAEELPVAPALVDGALRAAELADGGLAEVKQAIHGVAKAVNNGRALPPTTARLRPFDPALTKTDQDLARLTARLVAAGGRIFSLCLSGPSGTGKSAYARHLGAALELPVLHKRASDLLGKYVGESEKRIAQAFEEAREQDAFLIFDEADSLLGDRREARHGWEISQVNEMLTWMESHPLPFCCTTNLASRLDPASLRRFTFLIAFEYLDAARIERACEAFLGGAFAGRRDLFGDVTRLANLTPGDFATLARKAAILGCTGDPAELARMLAATSAAKPDRAAPIGYLR